VKGFQQHDLLVRCSDGLNDTLVEHLVFVDNAGDWWRAPAGSTTDGMSVPKVLWNIFPPTGLTWFSGVLHDAGYRGTLERFDDDAQKWVKTNADRAKCDELIRQGMISQGASSVRVALFYRTLRATGWAAWNKNAELRERNYQLATV